jgi:GT2 family glycosyltransferase
MINAPLVSIILVSYNTKRMTLECLNSIYNEVHYPNFEIIIVDNSSTDESAAAIKQNFPDLKLIALDENVGFGAANNLAAKTAQGEYLLLLNTDTLLLDDAVDHLLEFARTTPDAGLWGGRTLFSDGSLNPPSCWGRLTLWSVFCAVTGLRALFPNSMLFNSGSYGGWQRNTVREVDIIAGCFVLIRRTIWDRLGGFDPVFFMYGEDADLCLRAKALGYRPMITPDAAIVHYAGASEPMLARKEARMLAAKVTLIKRYWPEPKRTLGWLLLGALPYSRAVIYSALAAWGKVDLVQKAELWKSVIAKKQDWIFGFKP